MPWRGLILESNYAGYTFPFSRVAKLTNWMFYGRVNGNAQGVKTNKFLFSTPRQ